MRALQPLAQSLRHQLTRQQRAVRRRWTCTIWNTMGSRRPPRQRPPSSYKILVFCRYIVEVCPFCPPSLMGRSDRGARITRRGRPPRAACKRWRAHARRGSISRSTWPRSVLQSSSGKRRRRACCRRCSVTGARRAEAARPGQQVPPLASSSRQAALALDGNLCRPGCPRYRPPRTRRALRGRRTRGTRQAVVQARRRAQTRLRNDQGSCCETCIKTKSPGQPRSTVHLAM